MVFVQSILNTYHTAHSFLMSYSDSTNVTCNTIMRLLFLFHDFLIVWIHGCIWYVITSPWRKVWSLNTSSRRYSAVKNTVTVTPVPREYYTGNIRIDSSDRNDFSHRNLFRLSIVKPLPCCVCPCISFLRVCMHNGVFLATNVHTLLITENIDFISHYRLVNYAPKEVCIYY